MGGRGALVTGILFYVGVKGEPRSAKQQAIGISLRLQISGRQQQATPDLTVLLRSVKEQAMGTSL